MAEEQRVFPDARNKWPNPFGNVFNAAAYPKWEPIDTKKKTMQVFRLGFYTTVGSYAWLYIFKRTTFKIGLPMAVTAFATVAVGTRSALANLREKHDGWNTFWAVAAGNLVILTAGFKKIPLKHKFMTGVGGACASALFQLAIWAQSTSSAGQDVRFAAANTEEPVPEQQFWDVLKRRPLSQTREILGDGRGVMKQKLA